MQRIQLRLLNKKFISWNCYSFSFFFFIHFIQLKECWQSWISKFAGWILQKQQSYISKWTFSFRNKLYWIVWFSSISKYFGNKKWLIVEFFIEIGRLLTQKENVISLKHLHLMKMRTILYASTSQINYFGRFL